MATNHTANYNLNLWEPNDKFVRTEFNENTQKLDAALKAEADARAAETNARAAAVQDLENRKAAFVLLKEITLTNEAGSFSVSTTGINWADWQYVFMDVDVQGSGVFQLRPNGSSNVYSTNGFNSLKGSIAGEFTLSNSTGGFRVQLDVSKTPARYISAHCRGMYGYSESIKFQSLNFLSFAPTSTSGGYIVGPTGTIRLWGLA